MFIIISFEAFAYRKAVHLNNQSQAAQSSRQKMVLWQTHIPNENLASSRASFSPTIDDVMEKRLHLPLCNATFTDIQRFRRKTWN